MFSRRVSSRFLVAALVVLATGSGCLGMPDMATEQAEGSALSADGRRMRLIYRNRGWAENREYYELYSKVPYVSAGSVTVMGMRLAFASKWSDNTPVSLITMDTEWWKDADMGLAIFHRSEGTMSSWEPLRCNSAVAGSDLQYFHASQALIDLQNGELEVVPVEGAAGSGTRDSFERTDSYDSRDRDRDRRYDDTRDDERPVQLYTFSQCGISETNPEFSAFVFPYSVGRWDERFDYDFSASCDGDPCPAYRGDPNEPRRRSNGGNLGGGSNLGGGGLNGGGVDLTRASWTITDDSVWQCGRKTVSGSGNVSTVRLEIRGQHTRFADLDATLKKVSGSTNVNVFSTHSGLSFPVSGTVNTSNEAFSGTWELCVRDNVRGETGRIDSWSITQEGAGAVQQGSVTSVTAGASRSDSLGVGESDWYSITLQANQTLTVETSGACANNTPDTVVSVHSALPQTRPNAGSCPSNGSADWTGGSYVDCQDENEVGEDNGNCTRLEHRAVSAGTYYVRVFEYSNDGSGSYTVSFQVR